MIDLVSKLFRTFFGFDFLLLVSIAVWGAWSWPKFRGRTISSKPSHTWASHSSDFSSLDFFLNVIQKIMWKKWALFNPQTYAGDTDFIRIVSNDACKPVNQNFAVKVRKCFLYHGDIIELVILQKNKTIYTSRNQWSKMQNDRLSRKQIFNKLLIYKWTFITLSLKNCARRKK